METSVNNKCKAFTSLEQSKKLAEILPLESADMVLPFTHKENNEYVPGYAVLRNYIEVYNEMLLLPTMDKDTICKLIQPCWSLAALLGVYPMVVGRDMDMYCCWQNSKNLHSRHYNNPVDACVEMILKLHEQKFL